MLAIKNIRECGNFMSFSEKVKHFKLWHDVELDESKEKHEKREQNFNKLVANIKKSIVVLTFHEKIQKFMNEYNYEKLNL